MDIKINSGGREIIASGVFTTFNDSPSEIIIEKGKESFVFKFIFEKDNSNEINMKTESFKDEKKNCVFLTFTLFNFDNYLNTYLVSPVSIGSFDNGDKVHLHLSVRKLGNNSKSHEINYSFYLEENKNGKSK